MIDAGKVREQYSLQVSIIKELRIRWPVFNTCKSCLSAVNNKHERLSNKKCKLAHRVITFTKMHFLTGGSIFLLRLEGKTVRTMPSLVTAVRSYVFIFSVPCMCLCQTVFKYFM